MGFYKGIAVFDQNTVWALGYTGYRIHTVDGGETWYRQMTPNFENHFNGISKVGNTIYGVGDDGLIIKLLR